MVREAIRDIGYVNDDDVFHADKVFITNQLTAQSRDIGQEDAPPPKERHVAELGGKHCVHVRLRMQRDIGIDACSSYVRTPNFTNAEVRKRLRAPVATDCKSQVAMRYEGGIMAGIENEWFHSAC